MIDRCRISAVEYPQAVAAQRDAAKISASNPYFRSYGVKMPDGDALLTADAHQLFPPAIDYGGQRVEPFRDGTMKWTLGRNRFAVPAAFPKLWCVVNFEHILPDDLLG